ncbi:MAG: tripartite tricarboxylate transporter substrate binding protein [Ramlibacter sp.]|jgi:tripartite-type tricarboxylate transporter receptor subunit TctC|uniref:Bug family tripartite tricarboxylate transporter substrate binding protein n=1 Tax=Ramlibacter sp. TaxID=1917967 RepID=UPI00262B72A2|nr:tripartite tricarboxylate transporter substrate binding protein [Ramlibacter sp.]MDB5750029.1 tripartite tricarboxylate transporter substrate binding protein [Ramlibacter sp.]
MHKRAFLSRVAAAVCGSFLAVAATAASAQEWPAKPIRILVSFAPGGLTDLIARALQPRLQEGLGQPVVIENRPGAGGTLAEGLLAKAPADGYTILLSADSVPANPHLVQNLPYDTFRDLTPVSMLARIPLVLLVPNTVPATTVKEFVSHAKAGGAKASYGSPGIGTSNHLYFEVFKDLTSTDLPHVAYKGGGPAMTDLMGGHIQALLISSTLAVPQAGAGKVKALAVTSDKRLAQLPNVPTFAEAGFPDFKPQQWTGLFVPSGTPAAIVARIHAEFARALKAPDVLSRLNDLNAEPVMSTQGEFASYLRRETQTLGRLIKDRGITGQ